jgi:hypothetical protein
MSRFQLTPALRLAYFRFVSLEPCRSFWATLLALSIVLVLTFSTDTPAQSNWQAEWDRVQRAAENEEQLTHYGCCYDFDRVLEGFKKSFRKSRLSA